MDTSGYPGTQPKKKRNRHRNRHRRSTETTPDPEQTPNVTIITKQPNYGIFNTNEVLTQVNGVSIFPVPPASPHQEPNTEGDPAANRPIPKSTKRRRRRKRVQREAQILKQEDSTKNECCKIKDQNAKSCFELICPHSSKQPQPGPKLNLNPSSEQSFSRFQNLSDSLVRKLASLDGSSISITLVNTDEKKPIGEEMPRKTEGTNLGGVRKAQPKVEVNDVGPKKTQNELHATGDLKNVHQHNKVEVVSTQGADAGVEKTKAQLKAERKAAFEAQRAAQLGAQGTGSKDIGPSPVQSEKSKAELRAERRAIQEAQRLAKAQAAAPATQAPSAAKDGDGKKAAIESQAVQQKVPSAKPLVADSKKEQATKPPTTDGLKKGIKKPSSDTAQGDLRILSHLHQNPDSLDHLRTYGLPNSGIHPDVLRVGYRMAKGVLSGSNSRCFFMLLAFRSMIRDYCSQSNKRISQDLREHLDSDIEFLKKCRPLSVSMQNAITFLKGQISEIKDTQQTHEVKENLICYINKFIHEELYLAWKQISALAFMKILDGDVILTYSCCSLVQSVLKSAHEQGKEFRVIIVDSRPRLDGLEMLKYLRTLGISCTYILINAVSYIMKEVTKVMLGAHSLLANGYVMSRIGSSQIALVAKARNVPVLICCETYKFSERVHTDSFVSNELGPSSHLLRNLPASVSAESLKDVPSLTMLSLTYDVTPPEFVDMVITEKGMVPCTSVPVVLRMRNAAVS